MRSIFYHLMKSPDVYAELLQEIDEAAATGRLSPPPSYHEASKLPFLCATIKEAMRLHPSVGLTMPRITPVGGLEISGTYIPANYNIGMNAAIVGYHESIYGPDTHHFRPSRWLGKNAAAMDRNNLIFGAGTRTCIGKNVSSNASSAITCIYLPLLLSLDFSQRDSQTRPARFAKVQLRARGPVQVLEDA